MPSEKLPFKSVFEKRILTSVKTNSRFKKSLKFLLPIKAALLMISIFIWPSLKTWFPAPAVHYTAQEVLGDAIENTASRPQFNGVDRQNQPYVLIADHMSQTTQGDLRLTLPHLTLFLKSGETVTLKSNKAYFNQKDNLVHLIDNVVLTHSTSYEFMTAEAWINLNEMEAYGVHPIEGHGTTGHIQAPEGFKLWDKGDKIKFLGRSELIISK